MSQRSHQNSIAVNVESEREVEDPIGEHFDSAVRRCFRKTANGDMLWLSRFEVEADPGKPCLTVHSIYVACDAWASVCLVALVVVSASWPAKLCLALSCFAGNFVDKLLNH